MAFGGFWLVATLGDTFLRPDSQGNVFVSPRCFGALQLWPHSSSVRVPSLQPELELRAARGAMLGCGDRGRIGYRCLSDTLQSVELGVQGSGFQSGGLYFPEHMGQSGSMWPQLSVCALAWLLAVRKEGQGVWLELLSD